MTFRLGATRSHSHLGDVNLSEMGKTIFKRIYIKYHDHKSHLRLSTGWGGTSRPRFRLFLIEILLCLPHFA